MVEHNICRLKVIFNYLGRPLTVDTFDDRLTLQKTIYFTQLADIDLGYRFSWYIHGPYSPYLTEAAFTYAANTNIYDRESEKYVLTDAGREKLNRVQQILQPLPGMQLADSLEILASIHYLKHIAYWSPQNKPTKDTMPELLRIHGKPHFSSEQIDTAWDKLTKLGLIDNRGWPH